jgi:hypothetical protein
MLVSIMVRLNKVGVTDGYITSRMW